VTNQNFNGQNFINR